MDSLPRRATSAYKQVIPDHPTRGRVYIVTGELAGPDFNGGIGTANRGLALALQRAGHAVDVLYTRVEAGQPFAFRGAFAGQVAAYRARGVNLMCISHDGQWDDWLAKSFRVMEALIDRSYDIVFFDDTHGTAYFSLLAKRTGSPALAETRLVVVAHSATQWICDINQAPVSSLNDIRLLEMERRSIELADELIAPSAYILEKYRSYGWVLPERTRVRPNILPFSTERPVPPRRKNKIDEIVFFGRLERRKGLWLFCEALDRLKYELADAKVTFLGKFTMEDGESTGYSLLRRSLSWPFSPSFLHSYDREQALAYLKGGSRLAVLPSIEDNSPCAILECLIEGIPLLASSGSGGQELLAKADHPHSLFKPTVESLTAALRKVLKGEAATAHPSFSPAENATQTMGWVADVLKQTRQVNANRRGADAAPGQTLLLFAADDMAPQLIRDHAEDAAARHVSADVIIFTDNVPDAGKRAPQARIRYARFADFESILAAAAEKGGLAAIGRLDQPIEPTVLNRADSCLRSAGIDAVTVMTGRWTDNPKPEHNFVCAQAASWHPERYRTGNMRALLPLAQDAGEGLLVLRSECLASIRHVPPKDKHRCRLKDMTQYVHELLLRLSSDGHSFELMPDCFIAPVPPQASFETFAFPKIALEHVRQAHGLPAGSEELLLSKLAIETFSANASRNNTRDRLAGLIARAGEGILQPESYWPASAAFATYATVAHAFGRPDLALSLLTQSALRENSWLESGAATPGVIAATLARSINLAALVDAGQYSGLNLDHPWSFRLEDDCSVIEIHPNAQNEGQAALMFPQLTVSSPARFTAELELAPTAKGPVRYEVEIQLPAFEGDALHGEWDLNPGQSRRVEIPLPPGFGPLCDVLLATRMARRTDSTEGAHAKWRRPGIRPS